jgi:hypothetical protein
MAQVLDLSTKIEGGQYDGQTLQAVIGKDIEFVKLQQRLGKFVLREGAQRVLDGFRRAGVKQQKVEAEKQTPETGGDENTLQDLKIAATKAVQAFEKGEDENATEEVTLDVIAKLPEDVQAPYLKQVKDIKVAAEKEAEKKKQEEEAAAEAEKLQGLKDAAQKAVDGFLAGTEGATEADALVAIELLPEGEREVFVQSIEAHKQALKEAADKAAADKEAADKAAADKAAASETKEAEAKSGEGEKTETKTTKKKK